MHTTIAELLEVVFAMWSVTALIYSCWNYSATNVAPTLKDQPLPSSKWRPHFSNTYMSRREKKSWWKVSKRPEAKNECVGEDQQQFKQLAESPEPRMTVLSKPSSNLPNQPTDRTQRWDRKIWSWVLWDPEPWLTVLAKARSNLSNWLTGLLEGRVGGSRQ
jgi:hypothetical protein